MTDDRLITAIGRLERALSRIEARGAAPPRREGPGAPGQSALEERHRRLRARTQAVIERLDLLIGDDNGHLGSNGVVGTS